MTKNRCLLPLLKCLCFSSNEEKQENRKFTTYLCDTSEIPIIIENFGMIDIGRKK